MDLCVYDPNSSAPSLCINAQVFTVMLPHCSNLYTNVQVGKVVCLRMKSVLNDFAISRSLSQMEFSWSLEYPSQLTSVLSYGGICFVHLFFLSGSAALLSVHRPDWPVWEISDLK